MCGRTVVAVTLLSLVALVAWPERHQLKMRGYHAGGGVFWFTPDGSPPRRIASLGVLWYALTE